MKKQFLPHHNYLWKLWISVSLVIIVITLSMLIIAWPIAADGERTAALIYALVCLGVGGIAIILTLVLGGPYYRSLKYEIHEDEVIVRAGIITKSVKHVPFRTVTNLVVRRGILDRLFGIGTLNIQTAGMSGSSSKAEESLVGLEDVQEVYDMVATELRRFRGSMSPTQADEELMQAKEPVKNVDNQILAELKAIRAVLEKKDQ